MLRRHLTPVWIGILALACLFFAGQAWAQCSGGDPDADADGCIDANDICPNEAGTDCAPTIVPAALLNIASGCATYVGDHPVEPGQGFVVTYEFCSDGTATKDWNPDPVENPENPGDVHGVGTWSYTGAGLVISTTAEVLGESMSNTETYGVAFTYNGGAQLDWTSVEKTSGGGDTVVGSYASANATTAYLAMGEPPTVIIDLDATMDRAMTVTGGCPTTWAQQEDQEITCTGVGCGSIPTGHVDIDTNGTVGASKNKLYQIGGDYYFQANSGLVLNRQ
jgi:hypothetical protein